MEQTQAASLRLGILARLADAVALAEAPEQVAARAAAVLRQNDSDTPVVWVLEVITQGYGELTPSVSSSLPVPDPMGRHAAEAHALAVAAANSGRLEVQALNSSGNTAELHARPIVEPGQLAPSLVLVVGTPCRLGADGEFADYLELAAALIGAGLSGLRDLAVERQHSETLRELDAAKSAFLANVSHELRTPLSLIFAPLQEVLSEQETTGRVRERLTLMRGNVVRLSRMVDAMLDFSRMEAGRIIPNLTEVDVAALIRSLAAGFGPAIERAGLEFTVDLPNLPRPGLLDRDIVERIVLNLLSNALKYTPRGAVRLQLRPLPDGFEVAVTDTGLGIAVRDQDRVFARFEQLAQRTQSRSSQGAGIGLAMVKELTELLGGTVDLLSAPGRGSTFTVRLPYLPPQHEQAGEGARSITPRGVQAFLAEVDGWEKPLAPTLPLVDGVRPRLLIAEDSADMARYLADVLSDSYEVESVPDGLQALAAARARRPDALLSDVMMPGLDGFALVKEIRNDPDLKDLPVLLLSARAGLEAAVTGLELGADDYLVKPFDVADLRARLASNIRRAADRSLDASWRRAVVASMQEAVLIADSDGLVTGMNDAFTRLVGWSMDDGPLRPPYPWWPDPRTKPEAFELRSKAQESLVKGNRVQGEFEIRHRDGRTVWVYAYASSVEVPGHGRTAILKTLRDVTRDHVALERRQAAARVGAEFATAEHLDQLVSIAVDGLHTLFDGDSTVQVDGAGTTQSFTASGPIATDSLPERIAVRLAGTPVGGEPDDPSRPVDGILLLPQSAASGTRAWVQFAAPRIVSTDEQIVADLLAQAFALGVDRVLAVDELADRQANLERAIESHRAIGQAVGILVERHRITPGEAFQQLRHASQDRNIRLREIAQRVIETGLDPDSA